MVGPTLAPTLDVAHCVAQLNVAHCVAQFNVAHCVAQLNAAHCVAQLNVAHSLAQLDRAQHGSPHGVLVPLQSNHRHQLRGHELDRPPEAEKNFPGCKLVPVKTFQVIKRIKCICGRFASNEFYARRKFPK